jgi:hypothetical protein
MRLGRPYIRGDGGDGGIDSGQGLGVSGTLSLLNTTSGNIDDEVRRESAA